jgi:hypothetical protein
VADRIELKSAPPEAPRGQVIPEAKVVAQDGAAVRVTVDTSQTEVPPKVVEKKADRPDWLPAEFETPEAFADAWKKQSKPADPPADPKAAPPDPKTATPQQAAETVTKAGLDMNALSQEWAEKGELSAESLSALEKAGINRNVVDAYVEGQKAQAAQLDQRLAESVGGQDNLEATLEWAKGALSPEEKDAANAALQSGNEAAAKLLLTGLNHRRLAEVGREPAFVAGRSSPGRGDVQGYQSTAQMVADMSTRAYKTDPAFRAEVERRLAATNF